MWVCPAPHLYAPFDGLCWQVLFEARSTLERDHSLVNGLLTVGVVVVKEELLQGSHHWAHLSKAVVAWLSSHGKSAVVSEVQVAVDVTETISGDTICYG